MKAFKKYKIFVTEEELQKVKRIIPSIEFQVLRNIQPRSARSTEWREENQKKYKEYQKKYREKKRKEKEKNERKNSNRRSSKRPSINKP